MILDLFNGVPYRVREQLKHVPFLHLWDRLWEEASTIVDACNTARLQFAFHLYKWVLKSAMHVDTDRGGAVRRIIIQNFECHWLVGRAGKYKVSSQFRPEGFDVAIELAKIENMREPRYLDHGTGAYFYQNELDDAPLGTEPEEWELEVTQLPHRFFEPAGTVPSGCPIVVNNYTVYVYSPSRDAICMVCLQEFQNGQIIGDGGCELRTCLHLFHHNCIHNWVNGTAHNNNQCMNCHTGIFPEQLRRKLRVEEQEGEEVDDFEDLEDEQQNAASGMR